MSMVRTHKRENPFVQIDKDFIGNQGLSLKATGLLTYFLSKPDDWQIYLKDVQNRFSDGESSIRTALNELIKTGYVYRTQQRDDQGKMRGYIYEVYERPEYNEKYIQEQQKAANTALPPKRDFPVPDNPEPEKPVLENRALTNNKSTNNKSTNNKSTNNQSIEQEIPTCILKVIGKNQRRLIDDNIAYSEITDLYLAFKNKLSDQEYAMILNNVLSKIKGRIYDFSSTMTKSIYNHLNATQQPKKETQQQKEIKPEWFDSRKETKTKNEELLEDEKQKLLESLRRHTNDQDSSIN